MYCVYMKLVMRRRKYENVLVNFLKKIKNMNVFFIWGVVCGIFDECPLLIVCTFCTLWVVRYFLTLCMFSLASFEEECFKWKDIGTPYFKKWLKRVYAQVNKPKMDHGPFTRALTTHLGDHDLSWAS